MDASSVKPCHDRDTSQTIIHDTYTPSPSQHVMRSSTQEHKMRSNNSRRRTQDLHALTNQYWPISTWHRYEIHYEKGRTYKDISLLTLSLSSHLFSHIIPKTHLSSHIWEIFIMWVAMPKYYPSLVVDQATKWLWPKWLEPNNVLESMHETHHVARELEK